MWKYWSKNIFKCSSKTREASKRQRRLRGLSERGRASWVGRRHAGKHTVTHWVSLWDVINPLLLLTGGNLYNQPIKSEEPRMSVTSGLIKQWNVTTLRHIGCQHTTLEPGCLRTVSISGRSVRVCMCVLIRIKIYNHSSSAQCSRSAVCTAALRPLAFSLIKNEAGCLSNSQTCNNSACHAHTETCNIYVTWADRFDSVCKDGQ